MVTTHKTGRKAVFHIGIRRITFAAVDLSVFGGTDDGLSRRKSRICAGIPAPNDDVTMPIGSKILTEAVFRDTVLDTFLDALGLSKK